MTSEYGSWSQSQDPELLRKKSLLGKNTHAYSNSSAVVVHTANVGLVPGDNPTIVAFTTKQALL
jgi:hypothetical protein